MNEEIRKLLGGYATGTLTGEERERLFAAALTDQDLYGALADEQVLKEFLSDPATKAELLGVLRPSVKTRAGWIPEWILRPWPLALAGSLAAALIVALALRESRPKLEPAATSSEALQVTPPAAQNQVGNEKLAAAGKPVSSAPAAPAAPPMARADRFRDELEKAADKKREETPASRPMKVAVLGSAASDTEAAGLLAKKLDESGRYAVVNQREAEKVLEARKVQGPLDAPTAVSIGRTLGADAVIVANVERAGAPSEAKEKDANAPAGLLRDRRKAAADAAAGASPATALTAQAIDTRTSANVARANAPIHAAVREQGWKQMRQSQSQVQSKTKTQAPAPALGDSVDQVAGQLRSQLGQRFPLEGEVTEVNGSILTLNVGTRAGVRAGEKFDLRRGAANLGTVTVTKSDEATSTGQFAGSGDPVSGDRVVSRQ